MPDNNFSPGGPVGSLVTTVGPGVSYVDSDQQHTYTAQLDLIEPAVLADRPRRTLRIMEVLLEEALDNVRDALQLRSQGGGHHA
ncbi:hypothetical protein ACWEOE_31640 [Amycolatopsis sp. NPDC004368]